MKARLAITLGKTYRQEGALSWGYLTPPDDVKSEHVKLTQRSRTGVKTGPRDAEAAVVRYEPGVSPRWSSRWDGRKIRPRSGPKFLDLPYVLFLDSAAAQHPDAQYSFLAADPSAVVRSKGAITEIWRGPGGDWTPVAGDALSVARALLPSEPTEPVSGLPPFQGGIAGYIGYDWGAVLERLPRPRYDDLAIPDVVLGLYDWVIAWDHRIGTAWLISTGLPGDGHARERLRAGSEWSWCGRGWEGGGGACAAIERGGRRSLPRAIERAGPLPLPTQSSVSRAPRRLAFARPSPIEHTSMRWRGCGSTSWRATSSRPTSPSDFRAAGTEPPFDLYRRLRQQNPAPFAAYLGFERARGAQRLARALPPAG